MPTSCAAAEVAEKAELSAVTADGAARVTTASDENDQTSSSSDDACTPVWAMVMG